MNALPSHRPPVGAERGPRAFTRASGSRAYTGASVPVREALVKAGLAKRATCHTFRHSFATRLLEGGYDIRTVQELLGYTDVKTAMVHAHDLKRGQSGVRRPVDGF